MRRFLLPAALVVSMAVGSAAFAAPAAPATPAPAKMAAASTNTKTADCLKQWKAQKTHTQSQKAFLAACAKA